MQVGSALGHRGIPLQSAYCGAKHALEGFHESLRTELLHERSGIQTTIVEMPAVNTPQFSWVLSRLPHQAQPVPPIYQPEVAARAVLRAAAHPGRRARWVGASTVGTIVANRVAGGLLDRYLARTGVRLPADRPAPRPGPARQPLGAGRRRRRPRLRCPRHLRQPRPRPGVGIVRAQPWPTRHTSAGCGAARPLTEVRPVDVARIALGTCGGGAPAVAAADHARPGTVCGRVESPASSAPATSCSRAAAPWSAGPGCRRSTARSTSCTRLSMVGVRRRLSRAPPAGGRQRRAGPGLRRADLRRMPTTREDSR